MKTITTLIVALMLSANVFAQASEAQKEPDIDTITTNLRVVSINGDVARIMTSHSGRFFDVPVKAEYNPFNYELAADREYRICFEVDRNEIYDKQTRGQTGVVQARMIWFVVSQDQLHRDQVQLKRFIEEEPGYDRSPRY